MGKTPPRPCGVCASPHRAAIEIGLSHGIGHRVLAQRFDLHKDAIGRHARNHLSPQMRAAYLSAQAPTQIDLEALQRSESESLLSNLVAQRARLEQHAALALSLNDVKAATGAENAITHNLALVAKMLGLIIQRHDVRSTSLLISAEYLELRRAVVEALAPYPAARAAVGAALARLEMNAAREIEAARKGEKSAPPLVIEHKPAAPVVIEHKPAAPAPFEIPPPPPCPAA